MTVAQDLLTVLEPMAPLAVRDPVAVVAPPSPALAALALAAAHWHALGYPHRSYPTEDWLSRFAQTKGAHDARQLRDALHKLPRAARQAIADDLLRDGSHG